MYNLQACHLEKAFPSLFRVHICVFLKDPICWSHSLWASFPSFLQLQAGEGCLPWAPTAPVLLSITENKCGKVENVPVLKLVWAFNHMAYDLGQDI